MIAYALVIGPVAYLGLRLLKRQKWAWLVLPGIAVVWCIGATHALSSGRVVRSVSNNVSIVDASAGREEIVGRTFKTFGAAKKGLYDVGLANVTSGRVFPRETAPAFGRKKEETGPAGERRPTCRVTYGGAAVRDVPVELWGRQTFQATWSAPRPDDLPEVKLHFDGKHLRGTISNRSASPLSDVMIIYRGHECTIMPPEPGGKVSLGRKTDAQWRELSWSMRETSAVRTTPRLTRSTWGKTPPELCARHLRWISLFSYGCRLPHSGSLHRSYCWGRPGVYELYDFSRGVALTELDARDEAIILYTMPASYGKIVVRGVRDHPYDVTVVRMRVGVSVSASEPEEDGFQSSSPFTRKRSGVR